MFASKMKTKHTTQSEYFKTKEWKMISLTHKYMTAHVRYCLGLLDIHVHVFIIEIYNSIDRLCYKYR
jgi:hypothetical protein